MLPNALHLRRMTVEKSSPQYAGRRDDSACGPRGAGRGRGGRRELSGESGEEIGRCAECGS